MAVLNPETHDAKKTHIMEKCFDCYAEHGFGSVGIKGLAQACGISSGNLYFYFENLDDLVIQATEYCMSRVEDEFMALAPQNAAELEAYIDKVPYWTAEKHGKKYRLMYQIYTHPRYVEHGKRFFEGVNRRYTQYARQLEDRIGIPYDVTTPLIFILVRACVHYALFEDEYYLQTQLSLLKQMVRLLSAHYRIPGAAEMNDFDTKRAETGRAADRDDDMAMVKEESA